MEQQNGKQQKVETGFEKLNRLVREKNSQLILGLDPKKEELENGHFLNQYFQMIDEAEPHIVGIKPNLAFYERCVSSRLMLKQIMRHARDKGLVTILDAKRGDIANTEASWSQADLDNFQSDIVTLHSYPGRDAVKPFLDANPSICAYIMCAMSNPSSKIQDMTSDGLKVYQRVALDAHEWDQGRVGLVVGATRADAVRDIRMAEKEYGYPQMPILAPGLGTQGGRVFPDINTVFPISSGLTDKSKYKALGSDIFTIEAAAKKWKDTINSERRYLSEYPTLTQHVVDGLVKEDVIKVTKSPAREKMFLLKKGKSKLQQSGIVLPDDYDERIETLRTALKDGIVQPDDFSAIFLDLRDVMGMRDTEIVDLMSHLYAKQIRDVEAQQGQKFDRIGSVAYGALGVGIPAARILKKPHFTLRKENNSTHDKIVGGLYQGERAAMIEDVTTSGNSVIDDINEARQLSGAEINDAFVFLKRTPEGEKNCAEHDIKLHYQMDMDHLKYLIKKNPTISRDVKNLL